MNEATFWEIIESSFVTNNDPLEEQLARYENRLKTLPREDVVAFQNLLNAQMIRAHRWDLIGAACFLGCGQSDDGFEDFRAWLISLGRETFEKILNDVDWIADFPYDKSPTEEWHREELHMLVSEIGGEENDEDWPYLDDPSDPAGDPIEITQSALQERFPKFWSRFGNNFMIGIS